MTSVSSLADDLCAESTGGRSVRHERHDRLPDGGSSESHQLLDVQQLDGLVEREIRDGNRAEQLPESHASHHQESPAR